MFKGSDAVNAESPKVRRERLRLLSMQTRRAAVGAAVGMFILVWTAWGKAPTELLLTWAGLQLSNLASRWYLASWVLARQDYDIVAVERVYLVTAALSGTFVGLYCLLFFRHLELGGQVFVSAVTYAWLATSVATMSQLPRQLPLMALTMSTLAAAAWISTPFDDSWLITGAHIVIGLLITAGSLDLSRVVGESIRMRFSNDELVAQLADQIRISEDANRAKSHFLAAASHDLRQPASSLSLFIDALRENTQDAQTQQLIAGIERASGSINDLLGSLLDLSRLDAGVVTPSPQWVSIADLFADMQGEFGYKAHEKGLTLVVRPAVGALHVDPVLIARLLRNLLENAIRYTPSGSVRLLFARTEQGVQILVEDTGVGIDPKYRERVFDEYFQLANQSRNRAEGLGLGLAIVRRIAVLLDSTIRLDASAENGTSAILQFDGKRYLPQHSADRAPSIPAAPITKGTILIRENDSEVSASLGLLLSRWGFTVIESADNVKMMEACIRESDLVAVIADYRLPDAENGIDLLGRVRLARPGCKRILITGDTGADVLQAAIRAEVTLIHKPLSAVRIRLALA